ncbi:MAG TPA: NAD-dependent epimerase/dehydratase family protein [bacterium]|nr:NAD-dependent epimerase/dehydratase family protein [bacterium]
MKALVTGATGFIGSHMAEFLCDNGWDVRVLVRETSNLDFVDTLGVEKVFGDVRDAGALIKATEGVDVVFHTAAIVGEWGNPADFYDINIGGMKNLIDAMDKTGAARLVDVSSTSVHGYEGFDNDTEDLPYRKTGVLYSDTKMEAEKLVWEAHAQGRIKATTIRPCMVWGPRDRAYFTKMLNLIRANRFIYIDGGRHIAGLSHVRNVCDAMLISAGNDHAEGKAFIITDDCKTTMKEIIETLCDQLKLKHPRMSISSSTAKFLAGASESFFRAINSNKTPMVTKMGMGCIANDLSFDITRAKSILGYKPKYVFPQGMQQYVEWYKSAYPLK